MSIEQTLDRIAAALERIAEGHGQRAEPDPGQPPAPPRQPPTTDAGASPDKPQRRRGRPPKNETPPAPAQTQAPPETPAPSFLDDDEPPGQPELTLADVRAALVACQKRHHPELARQILKEQGGVDVLSKLDPARFAAVVQAANGA